MEEMMKRMSTYTFKYFGLPKAFKVIIAYDDGSVYVSEYIDRSQYRGEIEFRCFYYEYFNKNTSKFY